MNNLFKKNKIMNFEINKKKKKKQQDALTHGPDFLSLTNVGLLFLFPSQWRVGPTIACSLLPHVSHRSAQNSAWYVAAADRFCCLDAARPYAEPTARLLASPRHTRPQPSHWRLATHNATRDRQPFSPRSISFGRNIVSYHDIYSPRRFLH